MSNIPTFKTEDSLWQMLTTGEKTWDARKWDLGDERIQRLAKMVREELPVGGYASFPLEEQVAFLNKASGQIAVFQYKGYHHLVDWAPGWCFLLLGERVA